MNIHSMKIQLCLAATLTVLASTLVSTLPSTACAQFPGKGRTSSDPFDSSRDPNRPLTEAGYRGSQQPGNVVPASNEVTRQFERGESITAAQNYTKFEPAPGADPEKTRIKVRDYLASDPKGATVRPEYGLKNLTSGGRYSLADTLAKSPSALAEAQKIPGVGEIKIVDGFVKLSETQALILAKRLESFLTKNQKASPFIAAVISASDYTVASHTLRSAKAAIDFVGRSKLIKILGAASLATAAARASAEGNRGSEAIESLGSVEASMAPSFTLPSRASSRNTSH